MQKQTANSNSIWYCLQPNGMLNQMAKPLILMSSVILLLMAFTDIASAQEAFVNGGQLTVSDISDNDNFGETVAISGDTMVVGAPDDDYQGSNDGSISIFERNATGEWIFVTKKGTPDGSSGFSFGTDVDIYNDTIVVSEEWSKAVYVFKKISGAWTDVAILYGQNVAIHGDMIVTGVPNDGSTGSAYVYGRNSGGAEQWGQIAELTALDANWWDKFGYAVDINGDTIVVGSPHDDPSGSNSGSAYVFERNYGGTNNWGQIRKLIDSSSSSNNNFGYDVALSNDTIIIGRRVCCYVYLFERDEGGSANWGEAQRFFNHDSTFGRAVAIDGDTIVIGEHDGYNPNWGQTGAAHVYTRYGYTNTITGTQVLTGWSKIDTFALGSINDNFGYAVDIAQGTVVAGARYNDSSGPHSGAAYTFAAPSLYIPDDPIADPASSGHKILVPIMYKSGAPTTTISSLGFSIDYDESCLTLVSDAFDIENSMSSGFVGSVVISPTNITSEIDIAIWDPSSGTPMVFSDGPVATLEFSVNNACRNADQLVDVYFSNAPIASFGGSDGAEAFGTTAGAKIRLLYGGAPTDILLDNSWIEEALPSGTLVGNLTTIDPNLSDIHTYTIVAGGDSSEFQIDGNMLKSSSMFDYDIKNTYIITVMTTDPVGYTFTKPLTITVTAPPRLSIRDVSFIDTSITTVVSYTHSVALNVIFEPRGNTVSDLGFSVDFDTDFLTTTTVYNLPVFPYTSAYFIESNYISPNDTQDIIGVHITGSLTNPLPSGIIATLVFTAQGTYSDVNTLLTNVSPISTTLTTYARTISNTWVPTQTAAVTNIKPIYVIPNSAYGDCNHDGIVSAADFTAIVLEYFDGDGNFWLDSYNIIPFKGSPLGCNANRDDIHPPNKDINVTDVLKAVEIFFQPGFFAASRDRMTDAELAPNQDVATLSLMYDESSEQSSEFMDVQVHLAAAEHDVTAAAFSLAFDDASLTFDAADADGDGLPDSIQIHAPDEMVPVATFDANNHAINVALFGLSTPLPTLSDGPVVTVRLNVSDADSAVVELTRGSLSDAEGQEISPVLAGALEGLSTDNSFMLYLPLIY